MIEQLELIASIFAFASVVSLLFGMVILQYKRKEGRDIIIAGSLAMALYALTQIVIVFLEGV